MLPLIPQDKANHACYGALIFLLSAFIAHAGDVTHIALIALLSTIAAGALKEALDWMENRQATADGHEPVHSVELLDVVATSLGGLACYLSTFI